MKTTPKEMREALITAGINPDSDFLEAPPTDGRLPSETVAQYASSNYSPIDTAWRLRGDTARLATEVLWWRRRAKALIDGEKEHAALRRRTEEAELLVAQLRAAGHATPDDVLATDARLARADEKTAKSTAELKRVQAEVRRLRRAAKDNDALRALLDFLRAVNILADIPDAVRGVKTKTPAGG